MRLQCLPGGVLEGPVTAGSGGAVRGTYTHFSLTSSLRSQAPKARERAPSCDGHSAPGGLAGSEESQDGKALQVLEHSRTFVHGLPSAVPIPGVAVTWEETSEPCGQAQTSPWGLD